MQRNIKIVKETQETTLFSLESYFFIKCDCEFSQLPIFPMLIEYQKTSPIDIRYFLEEVDTEIKFLIETPEELTNYIKSYEENIVNNDVCLFHDFRTKYLDIMSYQNENKQEESDPNDEIVMIGFTIMEHNVYLGIKAFSLATLSKLTDKIINYCVKKDIKLSCKNNIRWVQLEQFMLPINSSSKNEAFDDFLSRTLQRRYNSKFLSIFRKIDFDGYFDKESYNELLYQDFTTPDGNRRVPISQISKYFSAFWKTEIEVNDKTKTILSLHDELLNNESVDKVVYTFKPFLMQYYQQHWFEDFSTQIIKTVDLSPFKLAGIYAGRQFDFFHSSEDKDIREVDIAIGIEHNGVFKIIAVECKKTLSNKEIQITNKKIREKVLNSKNNVFDAFIHIGCFNKDVEFDKKIDGTGEKYKQSIIEMPENDGIMDSPYYAFSISSIENFEVKMKYVIKDIFEEW